MNKQNYEQIVERKKENFAELRKIVEKLFGDNLFDLSPNKDYTIITVKPHPHPQREIPEFNIYWGLNCNREKLGLKWGKDNSEYQYYKYDVMRRKEISYIIDGHSIDKFVLVEVTEVLISTIEKIVSNPLYRDRGYNEEDQSSWANINYNEIERHVLFSTYEPRSIFTGSLRKLDERIEVIDSFYNLLHNVPQTTWLLYKELIFPTMETISKKFFIPLGREVGHYYSDKFHNTLHRTIFEEDIWKVLKACYINWKYIDSYPLSSSENIYHWNRKAHRPVKSDSMSEFEQEE